MDYIREELLRQQTALARLLLGAAPRSGEELPAGEGRLPGGRSAGGSGAEPGPGTGEAALTRGTGAAPALWSQAAQRRRDAQRRTEEAREAEALDLAASAAAAAVRQRPFSGGEDRLPGGASGTPAGEAAGREERLRSLPARAFRRAGAPGGGADPSASGGAVHSAGDGGGAGSVRSVVELVRPASSAPVDAGALSRLFQRDARRYDGGFELY